MTYREIDVNLTDEHRALRDMVRKFGAEVMRPAGLALDKLADPADVVAEGSVLWDVFRQYKEIGLHRAGIPQALGGAMEDMDAMAEATLATANGGMAIVFAGLARAAFDEAHNYAKERIQGGVRIIEHQNIRLKLFRMFTQVEASRAAARRMTLYNAVNMPPSGAHAVACKCLSTETAFQVTSEAIQILGGNGLSREYPVEKMFRDARASMIEDGVNESLALSAFQYL
jgi:alkylation response protein AidB-like acyl-CoA dehydrogenase